MLLYLNSCTYSFDLDRSSKEYKKCEITAVPQKYEFKPYAFAFQADSPYLRFFNYHLNKLRDIGGLQKMHTAMEQAPQECPDFTGKPLGLKNCIAAFLVMMVGIGSAIILLIIEKGVKAQTTKPLQNQTNTIEEEEPRSIPVEAWIKPNQNPVRDESKTEDNTMEGSESIQHI